MDATPPVSLLSTDDARAAGLAAGMPERVAQANIMRFGLRHPGVARVLAGMIDVAVLNGALDARPREIAILRVGWRIGSVYEWSNHVGVARAAGLTDAEITAVTGDIDAAAWSATDAALLRVVDELVDDHTVAPSTWAALARDFDEAHLIEVLLLVGSYIGLAGFLNAVGVEREAGVSGLPTTPEEKS